MKRHAFRRIVLAGATSLVIAPSHRAVAVGLRDEAVSYRAQGYAAQQRGDQATALSLYQKAAALDPSYPTPHNDLGILFEQLGRLEEAEQSYHHALELDPVYLEAHSNLALLYERTGRTDNAIAHWMKRYELGDPYDPWTIRAEERLIALGVLSQPGIRGRLYTRRRLIEQEFQTNDQTAADFRATTEAYRDWP